jgi:branched-chain amino acid transport system substrate-binding protein
MALEDANVRIGGLPIELVDLDGGNAQGAWDATREQRHAREAATDPDAVAYVGLINSSVARAALPVLNRGGLLTVSPAATYPGLTRSIPGRGGEEPVVYYPSGVRTFARVIPPDDRQGLVAAHWSNFVGGKRVFLLDDGSVYGRSITTTFAATAEKIGVAVVGGPETIDSRAPTYEGLARKMRGAQPELIYLALPSEGNAAVLVDDVREIIGGRVRIMASDGLFSRAFAARAGSAGESTYVQLSVVIPRLLAGKGAEWHARYVRQYQGEPDVLAAYAYEAMSMILRAVRAVGARDRARIREAAMATRDFDGILGRWSLDGNGDTDLARMTGFQIRQGKLDDATATLLEAPR